MSDVLEGTNLSISGLREEYDKAMHGDGDKEYLYSLVGGPLREWLEGMDEDRLREPAFSVVATDKEYYDFKEGNTDHPVGDIVDEVFGITLDEFKDIDDKVSQSIKDNHINPPNPDDLNDMSAHGELDPLREICEEYLLDGSLSDPGRAFNWFMRVSNLVRHHQNYKVGLYGNLGVLQSEYPVGSEESNNFLLIHGDDYSKLFLVGHSRAIEALLEEHEQ